MSGVLRHEPGKDHMATQLGDRPPDSQNTQTSARGAALPAPDDILAAALRLRQNVKQITTEEFHWQDSHYDGNSRFGRELLFLIANNEWASATSETVNISRSDAVDTSIKLDIDLEQITHEAFRNGANQLWLPLLVLPAPKRGAQAERQHSGRGSRKAHGPAPRWIPGLFDRVFRLFTKPPRQTGEPDPFATLTVTGAAGELLSMLPNAEVRHRIAAAMAEIIVNMAAVRWPGPERERPAADRDQRLVLSAAIYRLLRSGPAESSASGHSSTARHGRPDPGTPADPATSAVLTDPPASGRIRDAKEALSTLLDCYIHQYELHPPAAHLDQSDPLGEFGPLAYDPPPQQGHEQARPADEPGRDPFSPVLTMRAVQVLEAFTEAVVVVVAVDRDRTPTVLTVRAPTRRLRPNTALTLGRPRARMLIDLLLPSADADRQVQVNLPDGVSLDVPGPPTPPARLTIEVRWPGPFHHLRALMTQLPGTDTDGRLVPLRQCLADLAAAKADAAREALRWPQPQHIT